MERPRCWRRRRRRKGWRSGIRPPGRHRLAANVVFGVGACGRDHRGEQRAGDGAARTMRSRTFRWNAWGAGRGAEMLSPMADLPGGATFGSLVHAVLETADPWPPILERSWHASGDALRLVAGGGSRRDARRAGPHARHAAGSAGRGQTLRDIGVAGPAARTGLRNPAHRGGSGRYRDVTLAEIGDLCASTWPPEDPMRPYADRLVGPGWAAHRCVAICRDRSTWCCGYRTATGTAIWSSITRPTGSVTPTGSPPPTTGQTQLVPAMLHSDYALQALLYTVVLHRFLRWRQPDYVPEVHFGGVLYLFVRGMCGPRRRRWTVIRPGCSAGCRRGTW